MELGHKSSEIVGLIGKEKINGLNEAHINVVQGEAVIA